MRAPRFFVVYKYCHVDEEFFDDVTDHYLIVDALKKKGVVRWAMTDELGRVDIIFEAPSLKIYDPWSKKLVLQIDPNGDIYGESEDGMRAKAVEIWVEDLWGGGTGEGEENDGGPAGAGEEGAEARSGGSGHLIHDGGNSSGALLSSGLQGRQGGK